MKKNILPILGLALLFSSCAKKEAISKETDNYRYEFSELSLSLVSINNYSKSSDLDVLNAESISLPDLFKFLVNDSIIVDFKEDDLKTINLEVLAEEFQKPSTLKKDLFDAVVSELQLKVRKTKSKVLELVIVDSLKLGQHISENDGSNSSKTYQSKDSISIENVGFKAFCKIINKKFDINTISDNTSSYINYNVKFDDLEQFKSDMKTKIGLELKNTNKQKTTYLISKK